MIVVLDNRDSFVFNLARHFELLGVPTAVVPSHGTTVADLDRLAAGALVISPGPCSPAEAGCSVAAVQAFRGRLPILGVCLGHQAIAAALGARIVRAAEPVHGRTSAIHHDGIDLFAGIPSPMTACRYHSLVVAEPLPDGLVVTARTAGGTMTACRYHSLAVAADGLPAGLAVTARDAAGTIMAVADEPHAIYGVQFHPESILTRGGFRLLANFLERAGIPHHGRLAAALDDGVARQAGDAAPEPAGDHPVVTF
jgi:anthranilate synthase/aminodeoxychorismate synthase-like glutamine amidotransferase